MGNQKTVKNASVCGGEQLRSLLTVPVGATKVGRHRMYHMRCHSIFVVSSIAGGPKSAFHRPGEANAHGVPEPGVYKAGGGGDGGGSLAAAELVHQGRRRVR